MSMVYISFLSLPKNDSREICLRSIEIPCILHKQGAKLNLLLWAVMCASGLFLFSLRSQSASVFRRSFSGCGSCSTDEVEILLCDLSDKISPSSVFGLISCSQTTFVSSPKMMTNQRKHKQNT